MIDAALLDAVRSRIAAAQGVQSYGDGLKALLRAAFPGLHITVCGEDDIPARLSPAAADDNCLLYYVDAGEHCLKLSNDAASATGIVVALRGDD